MRRIVKAGASRMKITTAPWKKGLRVASGNGSPKSREKKNPANARKIRPTMYAVGLRKKIWISFQATARTVRIITGPLAW